jgi:acyl-CoA thioesterase FadM
MMLAPISIPKTSDLIYDSSLVTRFSQVDINGHMNNTRYFDIIDDALYEMGLKSASCTCDAEEAGRSSAVGTPHLVRANYLSELRAGSRFGLRGYETENGALFFEGADEDKIRFRIAYEY